MPVSVMLTGSVCNGENRKTMNKEKHLIVVSVDAMIFEDLEYAKDLSMFDKILKEGSIVERVKTIYPSNTHPAHASIMSGCPAAATGVPSNTHLTPGDLNNWWYNHMDEMKCETIFHTAHRAGLTSSAICWPLTACAGETIDYLVPPPMARDMQGHEHEPLEVYRALGCQEEVLEIVAEAHKLYGDALTHPTIDNFLMYCTVEVFKRFRPNLLLTHPCFVDGARHRTGVFSERVREALRSTNEWLEKLWEAVVNAGLEHNTDILIISDHGQMDVERVICPNVYLREAGFIEVNENEEITNWDAYFSSGGLMGYVYLSRPDDKELYEKVKSYLEQLAAEKTKGFSEIFTREEVKERYHLDGEFSFVIEGDGVSSFKEYWKGESERSKVAEDLYGQHGALPEKGHQPTMFGFGPSIRKGVAIPRGNILDHAPTFAKILGVELPEAYGKAVDFLNE